MQPTSHALQGIATSDELWLVLFLLQGASTVDISLAEFLTQLKAAGLGSLPGTEKTSLTWRAVIAAAVTAAAAAAAGCVNSGHLTGRLPHPAESSRPGQPARHSICNSLFSPGGRHCCCCC
jgi:hypothetical protein